MKKILISALVVFCMILAVSCSSNYTVKFEANGGTPAPGAQTIPSGGVVVEPVSPTKEGYIFTGWYKDSTCATKYDFSTKVQSSFTLYAGWTGDTAVYSVDFMTFGGTPVPNTQYVVSGSTATKPSTDPFISGCTFEGWYSDPELTIKYNFNQAVFNDFTLYAKYNELYTVKFESNGGTEVDSQKVAYGECATKPENPVKVNAQFANWYIDENFSTVYDFANPVLHDMVLYAKYYECFTISSPGPFTVVTKNGAKNWEGKIWYSTDLSDENSWKEWDGETEICTGLPALALYSIHFRGAGNSIITGGDGGNCWDITSNEELSLSGNAMALLDYKDPEQAVMGTQCFAGMFYKCKKLVSVSDDLLPAKELSDMCYLKMFKKCSALKDTPALPAMYLAASCYDEMFYGCEELTSAPALPARNLALGCYCMMFRGCINLTSAPELPATSLADNCYNGMFYDCVKLTSAPELPATELGNYCYFEMFRGCEGLTSATALPATIFVWDETNGCYAYMFKDCSSLKVREEKTVESESSENKIFAYPDTWMSFALNMFDGTSGSFTGVTPTKGNTYYWYED